MTFATCITNAITQGAITQAQGTQLMNMWQTYRNAGAQSPAAAVAAALAAQAMRKQQLAGMILAKRNEITDYFRNFRNVNGDPDIFAAAMTTQTAKIDEAARDAAVRTFVRDWCK